MPHHVPQHGVTRRQTFFEKTDYDVYLSLLAAWCQKGSGEIWTYCLMLNHVPLIAVRSGRNVWHG